MREKRKKFLINKPLQLRYMIYIAGILLVVSSVIIANLYFGIWGSILDAFSNDQIRQDLLTASRLSQYEDARTGLAVPDSLSLFKQTGKLSERQREVFKQILDETNRKLPLKFILLLILIAWATIYISHKIAGPLYHFQRVLGCTGKGDLRSRAHLRRYDEAKFLEKKLNETLDQMDRTFSKLKKILREEDSDPERLKTRLRTELDKIQTTLEP